MSEKKRIHSHLHCRSCYSLLNGVLSPAEICRSAASAGESAAAVTDINNLYGLPDFIETASACGIKPVCGALIASRDGGGRYLFSAYCSSAEGFSRLNSIITGINFSTKEAPFDPVEYLLENGRGGLVIASSRIDVLQRLRRGGDGGLYAALFRGMPPSSTAGEAAGLGFPLIALDDTVCSGGQDFRTLSLLRASERCLPVSRFDPASDAFSPSGRTDPEGFMPMPCVMRDWFSAFPEALANTAVIAECISAAELVPSKPVFPSYMGLNEAEAASELRRLCIAGIERRYGRSRTVREARRRMDYELGIICSKGFASYFLVVRDIVLQAPRTCGRGSAAASIVSYLLGITHVDPVGCGLHFERFLNMERTDPPDIDIDFPWDEREKALSYVFNRYAGCCGMVADHVVFRSRGAAREAARALGYDNCRTSELMDGWRGGRGEPLPEDVAQAASLLYGRPRYIGTHPGGVVITPGPISSYTHLQPTPGGRPLIAWEKDGTEACGLVKIDLLGNRSLAVLRDTIRLVNNEGRDHLEWESFQPVGDESVKSFIESGDTTGIFYIESPATRQLLKKMGAGDFEHLVAASSIIRPAANKWINEYVRRLRGGSWPAPHPAMAGVLDGTYGIMVYQEDVARVAAAAAGFSPGAADSLRKLLSKKNRFERLPAWKERFINGALSKGLSAPEAEVLWEGILSFDGYSFCKSHSASYALVSYRLAWCKLNYPLQFMASVINNGGGFYSTQVYLNVVRRLGFRILFPDVNRSMDGWTIEKHGGSESLRTGLMQVRGLSEPLRERILAERGSSRPFSDLDDFLSRTKPSGREIRMLIKSGALDSVSAGLNRPQLFWCAYHVSKPSGLFGRPSPPELPGYPAARMLADEVESLGLFLSVHPADVFRGRAESAAGPLDDSGCIRGRIGERIRIPAVLASAKEVRTSAGRDMCFVSFEDSRSIFETVFFPDKWEKYEPLLAAGYAFIIEGLVEQDLGAEYIKVESLFCLNKFHARA